MSKEVFEEEGVEIYNKENTFYNPAMKFNRDISMLSIKTYFRKHENLKILKAMCASGLRGIRYSKCDEKWNINFNDISKDAIDSLKCNFELNGITDYTEHKNSSRNMFVENKIAITKKDCTVLMNELKRFYDVIDIDPFGSCSLFTESALKSIKHNGLICFTCTDKAALCSKTDKCYTKYGAVIKKNFCKNETPLRVLLSYISRTAAKFDFSINPILSFSVDYYLRVIVQVKCGKKQTVFENNSNMLLCNCGNFEEFKLKETFETNKCNTCGGKMKFYGPFWNKSYCDKNFLKEMFETVDEEKYPRVIGVLRYLQQEIDTMWYYETNQIAKHLKVPNMKLKHILSHLDTLKYEFSLTHCDFDAFKTNAPMDVIFDIYKKGEKVEVTENVHRLLNIEYHKKLLNSKMKPGSLSKTTK